LQYVTLSCCSVLQYVFSGYCRRHLLASQVLPPSRCVAVCYNVLSQCVAACCNVFSVDIVDGICRCPQRNPEAGVLQYVTMTCAVRCSLLQCLFSGCCRRHLLVSQVLLRSRCVAVCFYVWCSVLQCVAVCCSVLQCVAMCCSVLQCVAV